MKAIIRQNVDYLHEKAPSSSIFVFGAWPRSGSTWLNRMVADVLLQRGGESTETELKIGQALIVPGIGSAKIEEREVRFLPADSIFVKSHHQVRFWMAQERSETFAFSFLARHPVDCLVSHYHFLRAKPPNSQGAHQLELEEFVLGKLPEWLDHAKGYLALLETGKNPFLVTTYESLKANPADRLGRVLRFCGVEPEQDWLSRAVANCDFSRLQRLEQKQKKALTDEQRYFRKGRVGGGEEELPRGVVDEVKEGAKEVWGRIIEQETKRGQFEGEFSL